MLRHCVNVSLDTGVIYWPAVTPSQVSRGFVSLFNVRSCFFCTQSPLVVLVLDKSAALLHSLRLILMFTVCLRQMFLDRWRKLENLRVEPTQTESEHANSAKDSYPQPSSCPLVPTMCIYCIHFGYQDKCKVYRECKVFSSLDCKIEFKNLNKWWRVVWSDWQRRSLFLLMPTHMTNYQCGNLSFYSTFHSVEIFFFLNPCILPQDIPPSEFKVNLLGFYSNFWSCKDLSFSLSNFYYTVIKQYLLLHSNPPSEFQANLNPIVFFVFVGWSE